ncbi:MAG TPA: hypothetical protein VIP79_04615 [Gemmatimonadaceae bacterium]
MSDPADSLPGWMVAELRRPVATTVESRARIMGLVRTRALACRAGPSLVPRSDGLDAIETVGRASKTIVHSTTRTVRRPRRGQLSAAAALVVAAVLVGITTAAGVSGLAGRGAGPRGGSAIGRASVLADTIDSALHDTLRLVRFALDAPAAARVALVGDFNDWSRTATPLGAGAQVGEWSVVVAIQPGPHRYAFVVDDTQWVNAPTSPDDRTSIAQPRRVVVTGGDSI